MKKSVKNKVNILTPLAPAQTQRILGELRIRHQRVHLLVIQIRHKFHPAILILRQHETDARVLIHPLHQRPHRLGRAPVPKHAIPKPHIRNGEHDHRRNRHVVPIHRRCPAPLPPREIVEIRQAVQQRVQVEQVLRRDAAGGSADGGGGGGDAGVEEGGEPRQREPRLDVEGNVAQIGRRQAGGEVGPSVTDHVQAGLDVGVCDGVDGTLCFAGRHASAEEAPPYQRTDGIVAGDTASVAELLGDQFLERDEARRRDVEDTGFQGRLRFAGRAGLDVAV